MLAPFIGLLSLSSTAQAVRFEVRQEMVEDAAARVLPLVEEIAGRSFDHAPALGIAQSRDLCPAVRAAVTDPASMGTRMACAGDVLAVYDGQRDQILVIEDSLARMLIDAGAKEEGEHVLRCVIAHELVHALQGRAGLLDAAGGAGLEVHLALVEGQAALVERQACAAAASLQATSLMEAASNDLNPSAFDPEDPIDFAYAYGVAFQELVAGQAGIEGTWWALSHPPERALMVTAATASMPEGWSDGELLRPVADLLGPERSERLILRPTSPPAWIARGVRRQSADARFVGAVKIATRGTFDWMAMSVYLLDRPGVAEEVAKARRQELWSTYWSKRYRYSVQARFADGFYVGEPKIMAVPGASASRGVRSAHRYNLIGTRVWSYLIATDEALVYFFSVGELLSGGDRRRMVIAALDAIQAARPPGPFPAVLTDYLAAATARGE